LASPLDPEASGVIGWALSGIAAVFTGLIHYLYRRLRKLNEIETGQIVEAGLHEFENQRIMPALTKLEGRISNVEKQEARLGAIQSKVEHLADQVGDLHIAVEKSAVEHSKQLTGCMQRIADQRKEDNERSIERMEAVKELIEAKIK
jgi:hypothetical protein